MLKALVDFLLNRKGHPVQKDTTLDAQAPYKVEPPAPEPKPEIKPDSNWPFPTPVGTEEKKPAVKAKAARAKKAAVPAITAAEKPAAEKKPARPRAKKAPKA